MVSRTVASAVDAGVVCLLYLLGQLGFMVVRYLFRGPPLAIPAPPRLLAVLMAGSLACGYLVTGWMITGRTLGDQLIGLRVADNSGRRLGFVRAALRAVLCVIFPLGLYWAVFSRRGASVADLIVHSAVRYDWRYYAGAGERAVAGGTKIEEGS